MRGSGRPAKGGNALYHSAPPHLPIQGQLLAQALYMQTHAMATGPGILHANTCNWEVLPFENDCSL